MLSLVKGAAIIGVIFLLSPVREAGEPLPAPATAGTLALPPALAGGADLAAVERTWRSLPDGTRQRLLNLLSEGTGRDAQARAGRP